MVIRLTLVVNSNILFAAAIKNGMTAEILLSHRLSLIAPEWLFIEFKKYQNLLVDRTHRTEAEFEKFVEIMEERIKLVPRNEFKPWVEQARKASPSNDFPFTALAKAFEVPVWSNDKELKKSMERTGFVNVLTTGEVIKKLGLN